MNTDSNNRMCHKPENTAPLVANAQKPLALETLQRTYSGLLDDVMIRYCDDYAGDAFFNKMIVKNVVFGGGVYLNDGYLINHPTARRHLYNEDGLLRAMINTNFIRILTRTNDADQLANMPQQMADTGNASFGEILASPEWDTLQPIFRDLAQNVFYTGNARVWPGYDMSFGFNKLMQRALVAKPHEIGMIALCEDELKFLKEAFTKSNPQAGNARHKLEVAAREVLNERHSGTGFREAMRQVMDVGNQAYHYNFGLTLTNEDNCGVVVDTTMGHAFDELLETREIDQGQLDAIPLINVPPDLPLEHGDIFYPFLDPTHSVGKAKLEYLQKMRDLIASDGTGLDDLKNDLIETTDQYLDRIKSVFETRYGKLAVDVSFEGSVYIARGMLTHPASEQANATIATAAPTAGLAITLRDQAMSQTRQFLVERFRLRDATDTFRSDPNNTVTLADIRPQITSLAFNPEEAVNFVTDIPRFD